MPSSVSLTSGNRIWLNVAYDGIGAEGTLLPCIALRLEFRSTGDGVAIEIHRLACTLWFEQERVSIADVPALRVGASPTMATLTFPVSDRVLSSIADRARGDDLAFRVTFEGLLRGRWDAERTAMIKPEFPDGEWGFFFPSPARLEFSVPRSEWLSKVLGPLTKTRFVGLEIGLPNVGGTAFAPSMDRLRDAEESYALGNDAGVFAHCRGAIEALPGYPHQIVEAITSKRKRDATNALIKEAGLYLQLGRHVSREGSDTGEFPVDHRDASLALNMTRLVVAHVVGL